MLTISHSDDSLSSVLSITLIKTVETAVRPTRHYIIYPGHALRICAAELEAYVAKRPMGERDVGQKIYVPNDEVQLLDHEGHVMNPVHDH